MRRPAFAIILGLLAGHVSADEPPTITWMQADTPPFHISEGPLAGQGVKDRQYQFLSSHLPQFQHRQVIASVARNWYDLEHGDGVCIIGVAHTPERDKFTLFSNRPLRGFGTRIILRREMAGRFADYRDSQGLVDLPKLARSALVGGYVTAMHYGEEISHFIEDEHRLARLDKFVTPAQLFNVLRAGRLDYIFSQSIEAVYYAKEFGMPPDELISLRIRSSEKGGGISIGCSNGPVGRAVIQSIDALLADEVQWRGYTAPYTETALN